MKIFIYFNLLVFVFPLVPIWDFKSSSIDLLGTGNTVKYTILENTMYYLKSILEKEITRNNGEITHQNYLTIFENIGNDANPNFVELLSKTPVSFEYIESFYKLGNLYILCPQGNFTPLNITNNMKGITFDDDWIKDNKCDLKCYYHRMGYFLVYYLINGQNEVKSYDENSKKWIDADIQIYEEMYDFKLENKDYGSTNTGPFPFMAIIKDNNRIKLFSSKYRDLQTGIYL